MAPKVSEVEVAGRVVWWLKAQGWEVYQEVQIERNGPVADLVAVRDGRLVWVLEAKASLGAALLEQASHWLTYAHYVSVIVPAFPYRRSRGRTVLEYYMRQHGIGCVISRPEPGNADLRSSLVHEDTPATFHRKAVVKYILDALTEEHKTFALAGNNQGRRWTPFKQTSKNVLEYVTRFPGASLKQVVDNVGHHYVGAESFRSCLPRWVEAGEVEGLRIEREGRRIRLYPKELPD
jgi:hypothetical protein